MAQYPDLDSIARVEHEVVKRPSSFTKDTTLIRLWCEWGLYHSKPDSADRLLNKALSLSEKLSWRPGISRSNNYLGLRYIQKGYNYQGNEKLLEGLRIAEQLDNKELQGFSYRYLGTAYYALDDDAKAINYYQKALQVLSRKSNKAELRGYALTLNNLGLSYLRQKQYPKAIECYQNALAHQQLIKDSLLFSWIYSNIGSAYRNNGDYKSSLVSFDKSLSLTIRAPKQKRAFTMSEKALTLIKLDRSQEALSLAIQAKADGATTTVFEQLYIYETLYLAYKAVGEIKKALAAYEDWMTLKTMNDADMRKKSIEGIQFAYENKKKQEEILQQKKRIEQQRFERNVLLGGILLFGVIVFLIFRNNRLLSNKNRQIAAKNIEINSVKDQLAQANTGLQLFNQQLEHKVAERTAELQQALEAIKDAMFKGQTLERKRVASELHDNLGSTLSGIRWMLQSIDISQMSNKEQAIYQKLTQLIGNAYDEVRHISHNLLPAQLQQEGLEKALEKLTNEINQSGRIKVDLHLNNVNITNQQLAFELYSICLELVNNVLKHAHASHLTIFLQQSTKNIILSVGDNGSGISTIKTNGVGLKNLESRVQAFGGIYKINSHQNEGTSVEIIIPTKAMA